jgi:hypothetical protein
MVSQSDADTSSHTTGRTNSSKARVQIVGRVSGRSNWTVEQKLTLIGEAFTSGSSVGSTLERHEIISGPPKREGIELYHDFNNIRVRSFILSGAPKGNRTPVFAVKGRRPGPLDDGRGNSPPAGF